MADDFRSVNTEHGCVPHALSPAFAAHFLRSREQFVTAEVGGTALLEQVGATSLGARGFPGWAEGLDESVELIETYVADGHELATTSESMAARAWLPVASWLHDLVSSSLTSFDIGLSSPAFITISQTPVALLEGVPHFDDDLFTPCDLPGIAAVIGQYVGPRVVAEPIAHPMPAAGSRVSVTDEMVRLFESDSATVMHCPADEVVVFPQFAQLHAGPATTHLASLGPACRQMAVLRSPTTPL